MQLSAESPCSGDRELLLELLNLASAGCSEQQRQDGLALVKRLPTEVVWDVMLELHGSLQRPVLCNGTVDQMRVSGQLTGREDGVNAVATVDDDVCSLSGIDISTAPELSDAASVKAATGSTFSLAQVAKASNQALTPRLGDVSDHDQSPDRAAAEQQRQSVSHRVLAALQQRELAAAGTRGLGSMELMTGSLDMYKSTADFCLVPGSHGEERAACSTAEAPVDAVSAITCSGTSGMSSAVSPIAGVAAGTATQGQHIVSSAQQYAEPQSGFRPPVIAATKSYVPPPRAATASANELRQSAVDGLKSFQLVIRTEGDWEDTASESAYSGVVTPTASPAYSMRTPTAAAGFGAALYSPASSCHTPPSAQSTAAGPALPSFSSTGSTGSRTPAASQQSQKQKQQKPSGIGLGRAINALRRSITGRKQLKAPEQPAAATATRNISKTTAGSTKPGMMPSSSSSRAAAAVGAATSKTASPPSNMVPGRLGSFTETERVRAATAAGSGGSSSRLPAGAGTPGSSSAAKGSVPATSSGYRPPGAASNRATRTPAGSIAPAAALQRSPLGKAPTTPAAASGRSVAGSPAPSTSADAAAAALLSRIPSTGGSAPRTPSAHSPFSPAAAAEQRTPVAASPAASAGLAWLKQHSEPYSAPVSPCPSRPESVASQYSVASTSKLGASRMAAGTGQLPGFAMTKQMVEGKQPAAAKQQTLQRTPGSGARPSAASAAAGSRGGYMRQGTSPADALAAAAAAAASRAGVSRLPGAPVTTGKGSSRMATASPFAAAGAAASSRHGFGPTVGASRQAASRCDSHIGLQRAPAAAAAAGRRAGGGHELRRSRSHGSLADLLHEEKREVSEVRRMWQQRAAEHKQHQLEIQQTLKEHDKKEQQRLALRPHVQQQEGSSSSTAAAAQPSSLSRPTSSTGGVSRIPTFESRLPSAPGTAAASASASRATSGVLPGPEVCESPPTSPLGLTRRSSRGSRGTGVDSSEASHPAAAAAAGAGVAGAAAVDASFVQGRMMGGLISRLDAMLQEELPEQVHSAPQAPAAVGSEGINRQLFTE